MINGKYDDVDNLFVAMYKDARSKKDDNKDDCGTESAQCGGIEKDGIADKGDTCKD